MTGDGRDAVLDGLRGVAALAVVYYHYLLLTGLSTRPGGGNAGVLVFFVLSGYLITRLLWRVGSPSWAAYARFVKRRAVRLYPALLGIVTLAAPLMAWVGPEDARDALLGAAVVLTQTTSLVHVLAEMPAEGWLHTWSLTVEWVFYLIWPIVVLAMRRRRFSAEGALRVALTVAAVLYVASLPLSPLAFYYLPISNLPLMFVGASLALAHAQRTDAKFPGRDGRVADLAFLALLLMVVLPSSTTGLWLYRVAVVPVAAIAAVFVIDQRPGTRSLVSRVLQWRPLVAVGLSSYSLYLWHLPVLWIVWWGLPQVSAGARAALALSLLAPLVYVTFTYLEKPWLRTSAVGVRSSSTPAESLAPVPPSWRTLDT